MSKILRAFQEMTLSSKWEKIAINYWVLSVGEAGVFATVEYIYSRRMYRWDTIDSNMHGDTPSLTEACVIAQQILFARAMRRAPYLANGYRLLHIGKKLC